MLRAILPLALLALPAACAGLPDCDAPGDAAAYRSCLASGATYYGTPGARRGGGPREDVLREAYGVPDTDIRDSMRDEVIRQSKSEDGSDTSDD